MCYSISVGLSEDLNYSQRHSVEVGTTSSIEIAIDESCVLEVGYGDSLKSYTLSILQSDAGFTLNISDGTSTSPARRIRLIAEGDEETPNALNIHVPNLKEDQSILLTHKTGSRQFIIQHQYSGLEQISPTLVSIHKKNESGNPSDSSGEISQCVDDIRQLTGDLLIDPNIARTTQESFIGSAANEAESQNHFTASPTFTALNGIATSPRNRAQPALRLNEDGAARFETGYFIGDAMGSERRSGHIVRTFAAEISPIFDDSTRDSREVAMAPVKAVCNMLSRHEISTTSGAAVGFVRERKNGNNIFVDLMHCGDIRHLHVKSDGRIAYSSFDHRADGLFNADVNDSYQLAFALFYIFCNDGNTLSEFGILNKSIIYKDFVEFQRVLATLSQEKITILKRFCVANVADLKPKLEPYAHSLVFLLDAKGEKYFPHIHTATAEVGDTFFSCSDGVTAKTNYHELIHFISSRDFYGLAKHMKERGLTDDSTFGWRCY